MPVRASRPSASAAKPKRKKRDIRLPGRYSKEFPIGDGHDYLVRGIPDRIWNSVIARADFDDIAVRIVVIRLLELYGQQGLPNTLAYAPPAGNRK